MKLWFPPCTLATCEPFPSSSGSGTQPQPPPSYNKKIQHKRFLKVFWSNRIGALLSTTNTIPTAALCIFRRRAALGWCVDISLYNFCALSVLVSDPVPAVSCKDNRLHKSTLVRPALHFHYPHNVYFDMVCYPAQSIQFHYYFAVSVPEPDAFAAAIASTVELA